MSKLYRFTLVMPACVTVGAMRALADHTTRIGRRTIMCRLLIAAQALVWNLLGA